MSLRVTLLPAAPPEPAPAAVPPPTPVAIAVAPDVPRQPSSPLRTGAWVAFGVGTAGLAGAVVSLVVRQSAMNDLERRCPQFAAAPCDPASASAITSDVKRGHAASTLLDVFGAVGVAGAVTGVVLWVGSPRHPASTGLFVSPAGVSVDGSF